jgi:chromosome segregation ATPase
MKPDELKEQVDLSKMSALEIDDVLDKLSRDLTEAENAQSVVSQERIDKRQNIAQLRVEIFELDKKCEKADHSIKQIRSDIKTAERKKFQKLREEKFTT